MTPASFEPDSYLAKGGGLIYFSYAKNTHVVVRNAAINLKISVSLLLVSSNPGVSMRRTGRLSRTNSFASSTSVVQDPNFDSTRRFEPLAKLIN